jgi:hypothetical protein
MIAISQQQAITQQPLKAVPGSLAIVPGFKSFAEDPAFFLEDTCCDQGIEDHQDRGVRETWVIPEKIAPMLLLTIEATLEITGRHHSMTQTGKAGAWKER